MYQIIRHLGQQHEVSVVCYAGENDHDKVTELAKVCHSVHTTTPPFRTAKAKRKHQLRSVFSANAFQTSSLRSGAIQAVVDEVIAGDRFDLVQFESSQMSSIRIPNGLPWIVDEHNIEYELLQRMYQTERSPLRKLYNWTEFRKFRRAEQASWRLADGCVLTSDRERQIVAARVPGKPLYVAPNGVDIDFFCPADEPPAPDTIVFTGLMSYRPNSDAVGFFVREVLPLIVTERPNVVLSIVGMGVTPEVAKLEGPNVRIVGAVPDVRPLVHAASVFVAPLRMGSGTRLKILEAMGMAKPIVATTVGYEGIEANHGEHLLVADSPRDIAHSVLTLLNNRELAARLGDAGRQLVERRYGWVSVIDGLADFQRRVVEGNRSRSQ